MDFVWHKPRYFVKSYNVSCCKQRISTFECERESASVALERGTCIGMVSKFDDKFYKILHHGIPCIVQEEVFAHKI